MNSKTAVKEAAQLDGKKLEIVKWAFERFYEGGFHATGIDTMMAESGISKRTLYKYFASKEELIEAVLDYYGAGIVQVLFDPVMAMEGDPRRQIMTFFDIRKKMIDEEPIRGCLGIKASLEYLGKHADIAAYGKQAASEVERRFVEICKRGDFAEPAKLGKQINIVFQGAVLLSQVHGDSSSFVAAKATVATLLDAADIAARRRKSGKTKH
jgi:AcrR family transcriptional regulator